MNIKFWKKPAEKSNAPKIGLICRVKDEYFIKEFVAYYLSQGVDMIYLIDDNSTDKSVYDALLKHNQVKIFFEKNIVVRDVASKVYRKIRKKYDWMIYVDADEFITTKKNLHNTIRHELETTFKEVDCIKVPWVMMACNGLEKSPERVLATNIYRWNNDLRHDNKVTQHRKFKCRYEVTGVKCIFKPAAFKGIWEHRPLDPVSPKDCVIRDSVHNKPSEYDHRYKELREKDVQEGYLLCYHYRIISVENCLNKLKTSRFYEKFTLEDLMSVDYSEVKDETLKLKMENISF